MKLSIFTQAFLNADEERRQRIYSESKVGNLSPVTLLGELNGYYIITGYEHDTNVLIAPDKIIDASGNVESEIDYLARLKPITLQGFADLATGVTDAIVLTIEQLILLMKQPEFKQEEEI